MPPVAVRLCHCASATELCWQGGVIYFGVQDDGTILGIVLNRAMRDQIRLRIDGILACMTSVGTAVSADNTSRPFRVCRC
jgi:hypothetical protein